MTPVPIEEHPYRASRVSRAASFDVASGQSWMNHLSSEEDLAHRRTE